MRCLTYVLVTLLFGVACVEATFGDVSMDTGSALPDIDVATDDGDTQGESDGGVDTGAADTTPADTGAADTGTTDTGVAENQCTPDNATDLTSDNQPVDIKDDACVMKDMTATENRWMVQQGKITVQLSWECADDCQLSMDYWFDCGGDGTLEFSAPYHSTADITTVGDCVLFIKLNGHGDTVKIAI